MVNATEGSPGIDSLVPSGEGPGGKVEIYNRLSKKLLLNRAPVKFSQDVGIRTGEWPVTEKNLIRANPERNDRSRLREMAMDSIDHARPHLIEAVVEDDDSALDQRAFAGGQVMRGNVGGMSSIDTDHAQRAATKLKQIPGGKLRRVSLMNQ